MRRTLTVAIAILLLAAGCDGSDEPTGSTDGTTTPSPTQTTGSSTLIDYGEDGVVVAVPEDGKRLVGAPKDFKAFIVAELARQQAAKDDVCTEDPELRVERIDVRGWAAGGVTIRQCGGTGALWVRAKGAWKTVWSDQTLPECSVLEKYDFPASIGGTECGTDDGKTRRYPA
jgi:hypothetical protein